MQFCSRSETSKSLLGQSNHCLADIDPNIACIRRKVFFKKSLRESARATTEFQNAVCPIELPIPDESLSRDILIEALAILFLAEAIVKRLGLPIR